VIGPRLYRYYHLVSLWKAHSFVALIVDLMAIAMYSSCWTNLMANQSHGDTMQDTLSTENRKTVHEDVCEQIQELIRKGEFRVGDKLPPERKLAETFNVSRNSVREALRVLAENNIVRSRHGDGTYVCEAQETSLTRSLTVAVEKKRRRLRDIFEFRRILEPQIAFLAAGAITRQEIDRLKMLVFDQKRRIISGEEDSDLDAAFHLAIARAAKNTVIVEVIKTLSSVWNESRSSTFQSEARRTASLRTHVRIVDALEKRDPEAAKQAMNVHLLEIEQTIFGTEQESRD
jgi:GntR family transcriptional regulator, transcriptional repressor for pyruvate dehydrogenase complex